MSYKIKKKLLSITLLFSLLYVSSVFAQSPPPDFVVLYSGDCRAEVKCSGCPSSASGGLARRASLIRDLRKKYNHVLVLDSGDFFWKKDFLDLRIEAALSAIKIMKYDALNIADGELSFDMEQLKEYSAMPGMPFLSSNIKKQGEELPWVTSIIKDLGGYRVAVLGVVSSDLVNQIKLAKDNLEIENPIDTLNRMIPDLEKKSDFIVLLAHTQWKPAMDLVEHVKGLDVVIVGHDIYPTFDPVKHNDTLLLKNAIKAIYLGVVKVWLDPDTKSVTKIEPDLIELGKHIAIYPEYTLPETTYENKKYQYKLEESNHDAASKTPPGDSRNNLNHDKLLKKFEKFKDLSPDEFLEKVKSTEGDIYEEEEDAGEPKAAKASIDK